MNHMIEKNFLKNKIKLSTVLLLLVAVLTVIPLTACSNKESQKSTANGVIEVKPFPEFQGKDFNGEAVDQALFSKNEVTLVNFWFNGCTACVNEMPVLEALNQKLLEKGAELIGINTQAGDEEILKEARDILSKQGVTYRNITINDDSKAIDYIRGIFSFPTTIMVDKHGNIIGDPIIGDLNNEKRQEELLRMVDEIKAGNFSSSSVPSENAPDDKLTELYMQETEVFAAHKEIWDRVFASMKKDTIEQNTSVSYVEFLKSQIDLVKGDFTEEELKTMDEDLKQIDEIEKEIKKLSN